MEVVLKYLIMIALILAGCSSGGGSSEPVTSEGVIQTDQPTVEPTYIWYGDSRCVSNEYIENRDCVGGRTLWSLKEIGPSYDFVIIHLGFNDIWVGRDSVEFGVHLSELIQGSRKVWCVLPTWFNYHFPSEVVALFRQEMIDRCPNTIDPGIDPYQTDQIHYTDVNYRQAGEVLDEILTMR